MLPLLLGGYLYSKSQESDSSSSSDASEDGGKGLTSGAKAVQEKAAQLKEEIDSLKEDLENWAVSRYGAEGFDATVSGLKYNQFKADKTFYDTFLSWRKRFITLKKDIDSTYVYQGGNEDSLKRYGTELQKWRSDFEKRGGSPSLGGSGFSVSFPMVLAAVGGALVLGGGAAYYMKKQKASKARAEFVDGLTPAQQNLLRNAMAIR